MQESNNSRSIKKEEIEIISWMSFFEKSDLDLVLQHLRVLDVQPGRYVFHRGDLARNWYGVLDGLLKAAIETEDGDTITYTGLGPGGWFGEGSLLKKESYGYNVQALRRSTVACLPYDIFKLLLEHSFPFCRFIMDLLNERLAQFMTTVEIDRSSVPEQRVALTIRRLMNPILSPLVGNEIHITQQELSYLAGLSRQRVNKALQKLQEQGVISLDYKIIKILRPEVLRNIKKIEGYRAD